MAAIVLLGLIVDGGGRIRAQQHADAVAREAARQAGQRLQAPPAVRGFEARSDGGTAKRVGERYLAAAGVSGDVDIRPPTTVVVRTQVTYRPIFLAAIGVGELSAQGEAKVRIAGGIVQ